MKKLTTSKYNLNADYGLNVFDMARWMVYNYVNNKAGNLRIDDKLLISRHRVKRLENWDKVSDLASPARRLCDFFWMELDWDKIMQQVEGKIRVVEIGCGSGIYGKLLSDLLGDKLESYLGIDIYENKEWVNFENESKFSFKLGNASTIEEDLQVANFIFTQSALEHFENDLSFFSQVASYVNSAEYPVMQVHLMPSPACITTFPWHGFRQYTLQTISLITELFNPDIQRQLVYLGGKECNKVHRNFITKPIYLHKGDYRKTKTKMYNEALHNAIFADGRSDNSTVATFYALLISSKLDYIFE